VLTLVLAMVVGGVNVAPGTPCVSREALVQRLEAVGARLPAGAALSVVSAGPEALLARYVVKGVTLERRVPAPAQDCDAVLRVVTALVQAWVTTPPRTSPGRDAGPSASASDDARGDGGEAGASPDGGAPQASERSSPTPDAGRPAIADAGVSTGRASPDAGLRALSPVREPGTDPGAAPTVGSSSPNGVESDGGTARTVGSTSRTSAETGAPSAKLPRGDAGTAEGPSPPTADTAARSTNAVRGDGRVALPAVGDGGVASSTGDGGEVEVAVRGDGGVSSSDAPNLAATSNAAPDAGGTLAEREPSSPRWTFGAGLFGGVASGATAQVLPTGLFTLDVTRGLFGAALDVGLSRETSAERSPGTVASSWQWLSVSARLAIPLLERLLVEVQLGVRGYRVTARASGFEVVSPEQVLLSVGAVGSVGVSFRVVGPVGVSLRLVGNTRRAESFRVDGLGPVLETGPFEGSALAGLVARF
jgi:hypothetical protein